MSKYRVLSNIKHDSVSYTAGDTFEGDGSVVKTLVDAGALDARALPEVEPAKVEVPVEGTDTEVEEPKTAKAGEPVSKKASTPAKK